LKACWFEKIFASANFIQAARLRAVNWRKLSGVNGSNKDFGKNFFRHTAFSVARMDEALLRIAPKLNYEPKDFFAESGASFWPGVVAQRGANSNPDSDAEAIVFFF
jgi:hypothetical protein